MLSRLKHEYVTVIMSRLSFVIVDAGRLYLPKPLLSKGKNRKK